MDFYDFSNLSIKKIVLQGKSLYICLCLVGQGFPQDEFLELELLDQRVYTLGLHWWHSG